MCSNHMKIESCILSSKTCFHFQFSFFFYYSFCVIAIVDILIQFFFLLFVGPSVRYTSWHGWKFFSSIECCIWNWFQCETHPHRFISHSCSLFRFTMTQNDFLYQQIDGFSPWIWNQFLMIFVQRLGISLFFVCLMEPNMNSKHVHYSNSGGFD